MASLQGAFSQQVRRLTRELTNLRIYIEAAIDFPDEEVDFLTEGQVADKLTALLQQISVVENQATKGRALQQGLTLVLVGLPNAGKSSLLNLLADDDRAIVTEIPGTTRDMVREQIHIDGMPLNIIDTAGLRESDDTIEQEGVRRAQKVIAEAHRVLLVVDDSQTPSYHLVDCLPKVLHHDSLMNTPVTIVRNKIDLTGVEPTLTQNDDATVVTVSAKTGAGAEALRHHLRDCAGLGDSAEGAFTARRRHLDALKRAQQAIIGAQTQLTQFHAGELVAEELRSAQTALTEVTGDYTTEDFLGDIFSTFCIGK
jgi:tRNA modification GTPase